MPSISHSVPISLTSLEGAGPKEVMNASAALLWLDRPFAVTAAHVVIGLQRRRQQLRRARICLGGLRIDDLERRILAIDPVKDLATLSVEPNELEELGDRAAFYSPPSWPARRAEVGDEIHIQGFPRDQWPAPIDFTFQVESATGRRFGAVLLKAGMPGRLRGLSGAPAFRQNGRGPEFVGIVVDSLFHNEVVRAQHACHVDSCGMLSAASDRA